MVLGVGVDMVDVSVIQKYISSENLNKAYLTRTFSAEERAGVPEKAQFQAEYYAALFAVKEAVFKAVAHLTAAKTFDLRMVETLHHRDGSPYVHVNDRLAPILEEVGVTSLPISITTEGGFAVAIAVAEGDGPVAEG